MVSYLKAIQNPDDSVAMQRIINTPTRGIGKSSTETLERIALETGISIWGAIGEAIDRELLQPRALTALKGFRQLMDDARAMYLGSFAKHLEATAAPEPAADAFDAQHAMDFSPEMFDGGSTDFAPQSAGEGNAAPPPNPEAAVEGFRPPADAATTAELLKFLIDRTGYIKQLEAEDTPEALARIDNLRELVNAAMDSRDRGETLNEFLDHAALVSDADQYDENSRITLMTLHAAKGLEFPLVILAGLEEGLFPHSRTLMAPDDIEEERRLCYVGMTRAMDTLVLTNARYRRRYGTDMPEASIPSRFLEEIPQDLLQDLGTRRSTSRVATEESRSSHYAYEDEDQRPQYGAPKPKKTASYSGTWYNSIDNIAEFFASRGKKFTLPKAVQEETGGKSGFRPGQRVRHPKYGEGMVYQREGDGENAKLTVQFNKFGLKKLVEKYAQLEKA
jgi:DNA helicase-2/ATP-dependent DNA helicase PcrA